MVRIKRRGNIKDEGCGARCLPLQGETARRKREECTQGRELACREHDRCCPRHGPSIHVHCDHLRNLTVAGSNDASTLVRYSARDRHVVHGMLAHRHRRNGVYNIAVTEEIDRLCTLENVRVGLTILSSCAVSGGCHIRHSRN